MSNWKCRLGFHDWETIEYVATIEQLRENVRCKIAAEKSGDVPLPPMRVVVESLRMPIVDRSCLRCHKLDLNINSKTDQVRKEFITQDERKKALKNIMDDK